MAKYADNGRAFTRGEVTHYFAEYLARAPREFLLHQLESKVVQGFRTLVPKEARFYGAVKRVYYVAKGIPQPGPEDTRAG